MQRDLKAQTVKGTMAMAGATFGTRFLSIVSTIFLARILNPSDFGAIALAMVVITTSQQFSGLGMGAAIIQSQLQRKAVAFHGFVISAIIGLTLTLIVFFSAGIFAGLLSNMELVPIIQWLSVSIFLNSLIIAPDALLKKDLTFGRRSAVIIISELIYMGIALGLVYNGFGLWSLVYAHLIKQSLNLILIWLICPGWDWLALQRWDMLVMRKLIRFGVQIAGSGFLTFLNSTWDNLLVGKMLGPMALGFYVKAYDFANMSVSSFNMVVNSVLFPSYSKIQHQKDRLATAYLKSLSFVSLVTVPLSMGIFLFAADFVPLLLGEKWNSMIPVLKIFAFMSFIRPLSGTTSPLFLSVGLPKYNIWVSLLHISIMVPLALLLIDRGVTGVAIAIVTAFSVGFCFNIYQANRIIPGVASKIFGAIFPAISATVLMMLSVYWSRLGLSKVIGNYHEMIFLILLVTISILTYASVLVIMKKQLVIEVINLVFSALGMKKNVAFSRF